jgi:beta-lactamase class A
MLALPLLLLVVAQEPSDLAARFADIARQSHGKVGVSAMRLGTDRRITLHGKQRFPMQSVYKFPIAMAVLREVDGGALRLEQPVVVAKADLVPPGMHSPIRDRYPQGVTLSLRELLRFAVEESDGTASDVLLRVAGGAAHVTAYLRGLGVRDMMIATSEAEMGRGVAVQYRNWATPEGAVDLLVAFHAGGGLSPGSHALLEGWMTTTGTGMARIKGLLPAGTVVAHKTGTSDTVNGLTFATNDIGIVTLPDGRQLAIAVFVSDSTADQSVREAVIAQVSRAAWDYWSAKAR